MQILVTSWVDLSGPFSVIYPWFAKRGEIEVKVTQGQKNAITSDHLKKIFVTSGSCVLKLEGMSHRLVKLDKLHRCHGLNMALANRA